MSVDFSDWSAAQTPVVTILVLAAIGVMAGVVCRLVLRRLYPFGYGQIGEPVASVLVGMLAFLVTFAVCMSLGMTPGGRPSDFDGALAESYGFESVDCGERLPSDRRARWDRILRRLPQGREARDHPRPWRREGQAGRGLWHGWQADQTCPHDGSDEMMAGPGRMASL